MRPVTSPEEASVADQPWQGDACSLVDAYRQGTITPPEALELSYAAIERSELNAFSYLNHEEARLQAEQADVSLPFGGVPIAVKELEPVAGWPATEASLLFADRIWGETSEMVHRLRAAGVVLSGQTTASEFGGVNCTHSRLHGTTRNPWAHDRTPGGSSGGTAAAVAGGVLPIATGSDGGGSIRIPAGFTGLFGLKATYGRIPRSPKVHQNPLTVVVGCLSRSVRDTARWYDVCNGNDERDTLSLAPVSGWEAGLGSHRDELRGMRALVLPDLGEAAVAADVASAVTTGAEALIAELGLTRVDTKLALPEGSAAWAISNSVVLLHELGDRYPARESELTPEIQFILNIAMHRYDIHLAASVEGFRLAVNEAMADIFDEVDFIFAATNPDVAFNAEGPLPVTVEGRDLVSELGLEKALGNNGALTIPANLSGNPAVSIPVGQVRGLPVGMQVIGRHHAEELLLDLALQTERERPWPLVAPGSPH
jgi:aspartyl-tRNA(Asn)/glutamyl-tRNA(Gln) amidotransferase subunit A